MTDQTPIEKEAGVKLDGILTAIAAAMGEIEKVGKGDRNKHDGYNFASIDAFLGLVNPICAKHGLVILSDEVSREDFERKGRNGPMPWMRITFSFTMHHITGQSLPSMQRTVEVMRNGAQAYGSAQSYCLKQFLRGLFLIPTGDKDDADHGPTDDAEIVSNRQRTAPKKTGPDPAFKLAVDTACGSLSNAETLDQLKAIWIDLPQPVRDTALAANAKEKRKAELMQAPADSLTEDEIPY